MVRHVKLIVSRSRQLAQSVALLAHYVAVFVSFVGRFVQWMVGVGNWTTHFTHCTLSIFGGIYTHLRRAMRWKAGIN